MSKKFRIMIPCEEANHVCDKAQYKESTLWEKIKLNLHLIYCKVCREYSNNNGKLTKKIKQSKVECLDPNCKKNMKKELDRAIEEQAS
ncbi:hypothetical protein [Seonamhaeicola maritimus]|uniref:hypothetical protein n=1 Tax=Seonamhaeicola maritimus TaxID=2591822 RepID=UPI00249556D8|nr:hypothetical protein [Seonamhaeicola maritimus]